MKNETKEERFKIGFAKVCVILSAIFVPLTPLAYLLEPTIYGFTILVPAAAGAGGALAMGLALIIEMYEKPNER